jgi:DNA-directed RNA polymerase specialized sigma54-like protein
MDGDTLDIVRVFKTESVIGFSGAESDNYETLCDKVRCIVDIELPRNVVFIFFDTFDGCISRSVIRRILRACISYQVDFVRTDDFSRSRRMVLEDIEAFTTIDNSIISRATQDIVIFSPAGVFTLNAIDASLERPSLFDEGSKTTDGHDCSRKSVLSALRKLLDGEDKAIPYTDEYLSDLLAEKGFAVARRTVSKYRELLGIPKRSERRAVSL